jgi:hypothetical protein
LARRSTANCWDRCAGSMPTCGSISPTVWSRWLSSSSTRIRAGWPSLLRNSAFSLYSGVLTLAASLAWASALQPRAARFAWPPRHITIMPRSDANSGKRTSQLLILAIGLCAARMPGVAPSGAADASWVDSPCTGVPYSLVAPQPPGGLPGQAGPGSGAVLAGGRDYSLRGEDFHRALRGE